MLDIFPSILWRILDDWWGYKEIHGSKVTINSHSHKWQWDATYKRSLKHKNCAITSHIIKLHRGLLELISILQRLLGQSRRLMRYITLNHGVSRTLMKTAPFPSIIRAVVLRVLVDMCGRERSDECPKVSNVKNNQASGKTRVIRQLLVDYVQNKMKNSCFHKHCTDTKAQTNLKFAANLVLHIIHRQCDIPQSCVCRSVAVEKKWRFNEYDDQGKLHLFVLWEAFKYLKYLWKSN